MEAFCILAKVSVSVVFLFGTGTGKFMHIDSKVAHRLGKDI